MIASAELRRVRFGSYLFDHATGELFKDDQTVRLQAQPARVLSLLILRAGELVTREELLQTIWPNGTSVEFDQGLNFCIRQIRNALDESASDPTYLETLPKRGYRFIAPVVPIEPTEAPQSSDPLQVPPRIANGRRLAMIVAGLAAILIVSACLLITRDFVSPRSILVRPFRGIGLPADKEWYADSLPLQLIEGLSRTKQFQVRPWSTSVHLNDPVASIHNLRSRYKVGTVIEGSIRQAGDRISVAIQVLDTRTERARWTQNYSWSATDFIRIKKDILASMADPLRFQFDEYEPAPARRPPEEPETYALYLRAVATQYTNIQASAARFEEVTSRSPEFAPAYAGLARAWLMGPFFRPDQPEDTLSKPLEAARRAITLDPFSAENHIALAQVYSHLRKWPEAEKEYQTALGLDPNDPTSLLALAILQVAEGRFDQALKHAEEADGLDPGSTHLSSMISRIHFHAGNYDEAIATARRTLELDAESVRWHDTMMRSYAMKGMHDAAMKALHGLDDRLRQMWKPYLLAKAGDCQSAGTELRKWDANYPKFGPQLPYTLALLECGDTDRGFKLMGAAYRAQGFKTWIAQTPELRKWHSDPRFRKVIEEVKLLPGL